MRGIIGRASKCLVRDLSSGRGLLQFYPPQSFRSLGSGVHQGGDAEKSGQFWTRLGNDHRTQQSGAFGTGTLAAAYGPGLGPADVVNDCPLQRVAGARQFRIRDFQVHSMPSHQAPSAVCQASGKGIPIEKDLFPGVECQRTGE